MASSPVSPTNPFQVKITTFLQLHKVVAKGNHSKVHFPWADSHQLLPPPLTNTSSAHLPTLYFRHAEGVSQVRNTVHASWSARSFPSCLGSPARCTRLARQLSCSLCKAYITSSEPPTAPAPPTEVRGSPLTKASASSDTLHLTHRKALTPP